MKRIQLLYLSAIICLLLPSFAFSVGDTFAILRGTIDEGVTISFDVYDGDTFLHESAKIKEQNEKFALAVTIPSHLETVTVIPKFNGVLQENSFIVNSGETLDLSLASSQEESIQEPSQEKIQAEVTSSIQFNPQENEDLIDDLSQGKIDDHEGEFIEIPLPKPLLKKPLAEYPKSVFQTLDDFFLNPYVLLALFAITVTLIVILISKE